MIFFKYLNVSIKVIKLLVFLDFYVFVFVCVCVCVCLFVCYILCLVFSWHSRIIWSIRLYMSVEIMVGEFDFMVCWIMIYASAELLIVVDYFL